MGPEPVRAREGVAAERALDELVAVAVQVVAVGELADARVDIDPVAREVAPENRPQSEIDAALAADRARALAHAKVFISVIVGG